MNFRSKQLFWPFWVCLLDFPGSEESSIRHLCCEGVRLRFHGRPNGRSLISRKKSKFFFRSKLAPRGNRQSWSRFWTLFSMPVPSGTSIAPKSCICAFYWIWTKKQFSSIKVGLFSLSCMLLLGPSIQTNKDPKKWKIVEKQKFVLGGIRTINLFLPIFFIRRSAQRKWTSVFLSSYVPLQYAQDHFEKAHHALNDLPC